MSKVIWSANIEDNNKIIDQIKPYIKANTFILLTGNLGAGKTTFTKMLLKAIGVEDSITSPTFNILHQYSNKDLSINHMDAYRLDKSSDIEMFEEVFENSFNVIEWWENLNYDFNKQNTIKILIEVYDNKRKFIIEGS